MAEPMDNDDLLAQARQRFKLVVDTESSQRDRERQDLLFQLAENQWTPAARRERSGGGAGGAETPPRPMVSISLLKQPMQLVYNQFTRARLGVNLHPVSEDASKELAEMKQGLYRRIERDGGASHARGWAFMRALVAGRGWYRINKKYDEDADPAGVGAWDQEIVLQRILHQENVYMDPTAQEPDFSDANFAFITGWRSKAQFRRDFPHADASKASNAIEWEGLERQAPEWVRAAAGDEDEKGVLVAEYWCRHVKREEITDPSNPERKRTRDQVVVYCYTINGAEVLETLKWDGKYIPVVPVLGEELQPVDGERIWQGMVRPARDAQMVYNYSISSALEDISRLSKAPYVGAEGQFEGHEDKWNTANVKNYAYLEYKPKTLDDGGRPVLLPAPAPMQIDGTKLQLSLAMADQAKGMVQAATAVFEPSLGEMPSKREAQSGRAILALQQQADAGTSQFTQNLVDVTLRHEARIILDLMPHVYDRPGRITAVVTGEDETETVMIGTPFVIDPKTRQPVPAQRGAPDARAFDLSKGKLGLAVSIGKSHQTRQEAAQQFMAEIVGAYPQIMDFGGDLIFKWRDEPGAKELADRLRKIIAGRFPGLLDEPGVKAPETAQAEMQAMGQQLQMLQMELKGAMQAIETDRAKQEAMLLKAKMDNDTKERIAAAGNETKLMVEGMTQRFDALQEVLNKLADREARHEEFAHEVGMAAAGGRSMTASVSRGQDNEQEAGREMSSGDSTERSEEDQPPQVGA